MLASLDEVPGVIESRVDWSGQRFLLKLENEADVGDVVDHADATLGGARRLDPAEEEAAARGFLGGRETWLRSDQTMELSRTEARILAERQVRAAAPAARLSSLQTERLLGVLSGEITAAFERIHAAGQGLPSDMDAIFHDVRERTLRRSRSFLTDDQARILEESFTPEG